MFYRMREVNLAGTTILIIGGQIVVFSTRPPSTKTSEHEKIIPHIGDLHLRPYWKVGLYMKFDSLYWIIHSQNSRS